jgi:hypothetical protein
MREKLIPPLLDAAPRYRNQGISIDTLHFSINGADGEQLGWISSKKSHLTRKKRSMSEPENMHEGRMRFELGSALKQGLMAQQVSRLHSGQSGLVAFHTMLQQ